MRHVKLTRLACVLASVVAIPLLLGFLILNSQSSGWGKGSNFDRFQASLEPTIKIGDRIVVQLQRYKSEQGNFPARLEELVPDYLPAIPCPLDGEGFFYSRDEGGFKLSFGFWLLPGDLYPRCTWDSQYAELQISK